MIKILYITRWNVLIEEEHVFIKTVWEELSQFERAQALTILVKDIPSSSLSFIGDRKIWILVVPASMQSDRDAVIREIQRAFEVISPDIIHSNMQEGYELEAAEYLKIPVVTTIHIGSVICPRGGNGLWTKKDQICDGKIGKKCIGCCCDELPGSFIAKKLLQIIPQQFKEILNKYFNHHQTFFFSRLFNIENALRDRQRYLGFLANAYPIAANNQLYNLLKYYGCKPLLIPHGVKERKRIPWPTIKDKIKFYYVGRISHQKGLHIAIEALKRIDPALYEFHIIGESNLGRRNQRYFKQVMRSLKKINGFFHGYVANEKFDTLVKDWHIMIHPAIYHEIYGLTISEALSVGRPVLATRCYGSEMQILDGENGWLVSPNDVDAMEMKIKEILHRKETLLSFSERCSLPHKMSDYVELLIANYTMILKEDKK